MIAKMVLPLLGGSPAVWNTCMVFFQAALLAGYAYAHATTARLGVRRQAVLHVGLLLLPLAFLPFASPRTRLGSPPRRRTRASWLLGLLDRRRRPALLRGLDHRPAAAALVRRDGAPRRGDPYFLYAPSNVGSMLALLGYPLVVEPNLRLGQQSRFWAVGYGVLRRPDAGLCGDRLAGASAGSGRSTTTGAMPPARIARARADGCAGSAWRSCRRA